MAKGQVPKHAFKKGQSGNPSGRPKLPADILEGRKLNQIEVARILNRFSNYTLIQLKEILESPESTTLELAIGKIMAEGIKTGDQSRINFILDRMIGKVPDKIELSGEVKNEITVKKESVEDRIKQLKGK